MNKLVFLSIVFLFLGCSKLDSNTYTLYRNSIANEFERIHVATFDANEDEKYNQENCDITKKLFQKQDGILTKFWCEKGSVIF
jgi:hypothetical protein